MNQFDENEFRKKIRSDLKKKHQDKQNLKDKNKIVSEENVNGLSIVLKNSIKQIEEDRLYSKHPQFIKCENHLHETTWLTALEKVEQHEYYDLEESKWQLLKNRLFSSKPKIPQTPEIEEYRKKIIKEIENDIEIRLKKYHDLIEHYEHKKQKNRIDDIIEQEEEAFYKSHPDYKLYRNYIGNTRWLTAEEYEQEEEYTERVRSTKEKIYIYLAWTIIFILVFAGGYFVKLQFQGNHQNGFVTISVNEDRGQLYVDEKLALGFSNNKPFPLPVGKHSITYLKDGFLTTPKIQIVDITFNDSIRLQYELTEKSDSSQGFVKIKAPYNDAKLFIDDEFFGILDKNKKLFMDAGKHEIELKKENYYVSPAPSKIMVSAGDTIEINFTFKSKANNSESNSSIKSGLLEINSNVKGAKIFLNREDTGEKTDYVFNNLPFKNYIISVQKDGYKSFPTENELKLSATNNHRKTTFNLTRSTMPVRIATKPVSGKIYINDREVGMGSWSGSLPLGPHKIRFGKVNYFKNPKETEFVVEEERNKEYVFRYQSDFSIEFKPTGIKPNNVNASIQLGYVDEKNDFISDPRNGPETRKLDKINDNIWWLGNAFNYRIPPANEAIEFSFYLPEKTDFGSDFSMKLWGYDSELSYPLELSGGCHFRIEVNKQEIHQKYEPRYKLDNIGENKYIRFQLGNVLHSGKNVIVISTAKINKVFFGLWKIEIQ